MKKTPHIPRGAPSGEKMKKCICNICVWFLVLVCVGFVGAASDVSVLQGQYYTGTTFNVGTYSFNFTIYDSLTGGSACYSNASNLTTDDFGLWKIELFGISESCNNASKDYFVNVNIDGTDQTPRRRLVNFDFIRKNVAEESSGNLTLSGNVFTRFLGELTNRVKEFFVEDINFNGTISGSGNLNVTGNIETSNNVTADYFIGNGSQLTNLPSGDNSSWNETHANTLYITDAEADLNVNSSTWWNSVSGWVTGWFIKTGDNLDFNETKLNESIESYGYITSYSETDPLWSGNQSSYSTTTEIIAFGYYNSSDFVITDYFTKTQIENFGYYNSSDFSISDYFTSAEILAFNYYNSSDFDIADYYNSSQIEGFNYYNSSDFDINDYATNVKVDSVGNFSDWDKDYADLTNKPTLLSNFTDDLGDRDYTHLSNYTDDLGNRGYTHLSNYTDDILWTSEFNSTGDAKWLDDTTIGNCSVDNSCPNITYDSELDYTTDTNASTACSASEVLLGNGTCHNSTLFYDDTISNETQTILDNNASWVSTYNATYDAKVTDNSSWNETHADTLYVNTDAEADLNVNSSDYLDTYDSSYFMPLNTSVSGNFDFNGGWLSNGFSIIGGDIYAQTGYFYNISSLLVSQLSINGSMLPYVGFNNTFDIGNSSGRWWRDIYMAGKIYFTSGNLFANSTSLYYDNGTTTTDLTAGDQDVPYGAIQAFYLASCPSGWVLADGTDNTPDLRGLFIRGSGTSGVLKDANGNYISATYGEYYNDSFQGHWHESDFSKGYTAGATHSPTSGGNLLTTGESAKDPKTDTVHGTPRTSNETRPFSYNTIYCMKISNQKFLTGVVETYDTGWVANSDWTNQHLGTTAGGNVTHNLDAPLSELDVKVLFSTDGTDDNSFEIPFLIDRHPTADETWGLTIFAEDNNNFHVQTGAQGVPFLNDASGVLNTVAGYYKVVVQKVPEYVGVEIGDYKINGDLNVTENLTVTGIIEGEIKNYDTGWINRADWTNVHLGSNTTKNADSNVTHNLNAPLSDLLVRVMIDETGDDDNSFEIIYAVKEDGAMGNSGIGIHQVDSNNIIVQTTGSGFRYVNGAGNVVQIHTQNWYYKIKVFKLG